MEKRYVGKKYVWKAFFLFAFVLAFGCNTGLVIIEQPRGHAKKEASPERSYAKKTIKADAYAKDFGYQRGFNAAQSMGFKPVGGIDKKEGVFNGERDGDVLTFVIKRGSGGYAMTIEVESDKKAGDILKDFIKAYEEEEKGRGKGKSKR